MRDEEAMKEEVSEEMSMPVQPDLVLLPLNVWGRANEAGRAEQALI